MARAVKSPPEPRMRELREKRAQLRADLEQVGATVRDAQAGLQRVPGRERQARLAAELHVEGESLESIAQEAERWQRQLAACEPRIAALNEADGVLGREQLAVVDENLAFYADKASVASERAEVTVDRALAAIGEAQGAWQEAELRWQVVRASKVRRGEAEQPHVPSPDFGQVTFRLNQITDPPPWPGGRRPGEAWTPRRREATPPAPRL